MVQEVPWVVRAFFSVMFMMAMWLALQAIERRINPAGFDLGMHQRIEQTEQLVQQNLERAGKQ